MFGQHCVQIPLLDGECLEDIETFSVVLTSDDAGADFTVETATVQILEDPSDCEYSMGSHVPGALLL